MLSKSARRALVASVMLLLVFGIQGVAQDENDPHRPPCTSAGCKKVQSFLKARYCGESPFGNGPDEGCDLRGRKGIGSNSRVSADSYCQWDDKYTKGTCEQRGQPSAQVRKALIGELRTLGLRANAPGEIHFTVLESKPSGWTLAKAGYVHVAGVDFTLCQVVIAVDRKSRVRVLRRVPLKKTNVDVPEVTTWSPVDMADADGDGKLDVILRGDAYENHWLEVVSLRNGKVETTFSGLGYYL